MISRKAIHNKLRAQAALRDLPNDIQAIVSAVCEKLGAPEESSDIASSMDGIAYVTQYINWLSKTLDKGLYNVKNILTRWIAEKNPEAYYDGNSILYVPVGDDRQLSFHVHHDKDGSECYNMAHGNEIEWDRKHRQPLAEVYLVNYIGNGNAETLKMEYENEHGI